MVDDNDKTIFEYIKSFDNDNLLMYIENRIRDLVFLLDKYFLVLVMRLILK